MGLLLSLLLLPIPGIHTVLDTDTMADMVDTAMDMDMVVTWEATMAGAARRGLLMLSQLLLLIPGMGMGMVLDTEDIMADTAMVDTSAMVDMEAICGAVRGGLLMLSPLLMLIPGIHMVDTAIMVDTDMAMAMDTDWAMGMVTMVDTMAGGSKLDSATHLITTCRTLSVSFLQH